MEDRLTFYHPTEEKLNVISHGLGLVLSIFALIFLVKYAISDGTFWHVISFSIYGASLVILYSASTFYHYVQEPKLRYKLNIFDHAAIYVLIAGSYTPFTINVMQGTLGWGLFTTVWVIAVTGITLKLFFTGKYGKISTVAYIVMGWLGVFGLKSLYDALPIEGIVWLLAGGASYTVGAILYSLKNVKYNHAIFHVFVLLGSICHFVSVFLYVLPYQPDVVKNIELIIK
jgi:hemolysin III